MVSCARPLRKTCDSGPVIYIYNLGWKFTQDGQLVCTFGSQDSGAGQFSSPQGIAVPPDGQVYVSDTSNGRVQVFTADGTYIRAFGQGQLNGPIGLTFTTQGNVVVASSGNSRMSIFDLEGQLVHTLNVGSDLRPYGNPWRSKFLQGGIPWMMAAAHG